MFWIKKKNKDLEKRIVQRKKEVLDKELPQKIIAIAEELGEHMPFPGYEGYTVRHDDLAHVYKDSMLEVTMSFPFTIRTTRGSEEIIVRWDKDTVFKVFRENKYDKKGEYNGQDYRIESFIPGEQWEAAVETANYQAMGEKMKRVAERLEKEEQEEAALKRNWGLG